MSQFHQTMHISFDRLLPGEIRAMNESASENMIVGLDIGTSKVVAIVGDINL